MTPKEHELLRGMGNCYEACGEDFTNTVAMVARNRGLTPEYVTSALGEIKKQYADDPDYKRLRARLPADFEA